MPLGLLILLGLPFGFGFVLGRYVRRRTAILVGVVAAVVALAPVGLLLAAASDCSDDDGCHGPGVALIVVGLLGLLVGLIGGLVLGAYVRGDQAPGTGSA